MPGAATAGPTPATANIGGAAATGVSSGTTAGIAADGMALRPDRPAKPVIAPRWAMTPVRAADSNCGYWPSQVAIWAMCVGKSTTTT
ncbi:Uncharacterised protein [Mycobacterium tuberculosis]|nr:Uncharacterised protein [Mycobacterium tuberculosis]